MKSRWKQGKTGEKSQDTAKFAPPIPLVRNFCTTHPPVRIRFCDQIFKSMLSVPTQNLSAKITGMRTLCEPCANSFLCQFSKPCSLSWRTIGMRNFRTTHHLVRNSHFLFKSHFLLFNSKLLLLQFSQHLSSDHPFPSLSSSPSSSPILNTTMAAHPHSFTP